MSFICSQFPTKSPGLQNSIVLLLRHYLTKFIFTAIEIKVAQILAAVNNILKYLGNICFGGIHKLLFFCI